MSTSQFEYLLTCPRVGILLKVGGRFISRRLLMTFRLFVDFIVPVVFGKHKNQQGDHCLVY